MKSRPVKRQHWQFDVHNQWPGLFRKDLNWYDFTFIHFDVEYTPYEGSCSTTIALLGLQLAITYRYNFDFIDEMDLRSELIARLEDEHPGMEIKDPLGQLDKLKQSSTNEKNSS